MLSLLLMTALSARQQLDDCAAGRCWDNRPNLTVEAPASAGSRPVLAPRQPRPSPPPGEVRLPKDPGPEERHKLHQVVLGGAGAFVGYLAVKGLGLGLLGGLVGALSGAALGLGVAYLIYRTTRRKGT